MLILWVDTQDKPFGCTQCDSHFSRRYSNIRIRFTTDFDKPNNYSDLLIRHQRLTHDKDASNELQIGNENREQSSPAPSRTSKRRRVAFDSDGETGDISPSPMTAFNFDNVPTTASTFDPSMDLGLGTGYSLATLSMAAEYTAAQGNGLLHASDHTPHLLTNEDLPHIDNPSSTMASQFDTAQTYGLGFEESLDNLAAFLDTEPLSAYNFSSLMTAGQPMVLFSPGSFGYDDDLTYTSAPGMPGVQQNQRKDEPNSFSRFGSRLPSLQPEDSPAQCTQSPTARQLSDISSGDRQIIATKLEEFPMAVSCDFVLPSRLALSRYLAAYVNGFHEHLPFLHIPTMSAENCSIELVLAMAAVGAQYCFEGGKGVELFNASQAISSCRIRRRDASLVESYGHSITTGTAQNSNGTSSEKVPESAASGPLGLPSGSEATLEIQSQRQDLIQTAQALLLLMAMATWAKHREILREALSIQSVLATLIRDDGLKDEPLPEDVSWKDWVRYESTKRTKLVVFCFFNLHCIVYNIPPLILNSEIKLALPSTAAEFKASNVSTWGRCKKESRSCTKFSRSSTTIVLSQR